MRVGITGKSEKAFIEMMEACQIDNPTHLNNLMISFIKNNPNTYQEAIKYAQNQDLQRMQKEI